MLCAFYHKFFKRVKETTSIIRKFKWSHSTQSSEVGQLWSVCSLSSVTSGRTQEPFPLWPGHFWDQNQLPEVEDHIEQAEPNKAAPLGRWGVESGCWKEPCLLQLCKIMLNKVTYESSSPRLCHTRSKCFTGTVTLSCSKNFFFNYCNANSSIAYVVQSPSHNS